MAKKKKSRKVKGVLVVLKSTAVKENGKKTNHKIYTYRNKTVDTTNKKKIRNINATTGKLELKKYDPLAKKHVLYVETKSS